jgi:hypothetical protein
VVHLARYRTDGKPDGFWSQTAISCRTNHPKRRDTSSQNRLTMAS